MEKILLVNISLNILAIVLIVIIIKRYKKNNGKTDRHYPYIDDSKNDEIEIEKWIELSKKYDDIDSKIDILSKVFNRYTYSKKIFEIYKSVLYLNLENNANDIRSYNRIYELIDVYLRFCSVDEFEIFNKEKIQIKRETEVKLEELNNKYIRQQLEKLEKLEERVDSLQGSMLNDKDTLMEIKLIDDSIDKKLLQTSESKMKYEQILTKIKEINSINGDVEYNRDKLNIIKKTYTQFIKSKKMINKINGINKKKRNKEQSISNNSNKITNDELNNNLIHDEEINNSISNDELDKVVRLEEIDENRLFPEVLRYLMYIKGDMFSKMNKKEKYSYTEKQLLRRK